MKRSRWFFAAALVAFAGRASAQPSPADQAAADALFNEAFKLMQAGRAAEACPKLVEAQRLDPTPGTLLNLADCYERTGKLASALGAFGEAEAAARNKGDKPRMEEAGRRAKLLAPKVSKLRVTVPAAARAPGLIVKRDGQPMGEGSWNAEIPVDPGEHVIVVTAPGRKRWSGKVTAASAGTVSVEVPALADVPADEPAPGNTADAPALSFWGPRRIAGAAVGGVGLVGIAIGTAFGVVTLSKTSDAKRHCTGGTPDRCDPQGIALQGDAKTTANVSNAAFAVGGAGLIAGVVLFATAPSAAPKPNAARVRVAPVAGMGTTGIWIDGSF